MEGIACNVCNHPIRGHNRDGCLVAGCVCRAAVNTGYSGFKRDHAADAKTFDYYVSMAAMLLGRTLTWNRKSTIKSRKRIFDLAEGLLIDRTRRLGRLGIKE